MKYKPEKSFVTEEKLIDDGPWSGIANSVDSYLNFHSSIFYCTELASSAPIFWLVFDVYGAIHSKTYSNCLMMMNCFSAFYEPHFRSKRRFHLHRTHFLFWSLACRRTCDAIHVACDEVSTLILAFLHHVPAAAVFGVQFFQFQLFYQLCLKIKNW